MATPVRTLTDRWPTLDVLLKAVLAKQDVTDLATPVAPRLLNVSGDIVGPWFTKAGDRARMSLEEVWPMLFMLDAGNNVSIRVKVLTALPEVEGDPERDGAAGFLSLADGNLHAGDERLARAMIVEIDDDLPAVLLILTDQA